METHELPTAKVRRPTGVWIATIWAALFAGLLPLVFVLLFYFGPAEGSEWMTRLQLALSLALGAGIIVSAIGAWSGVSLARYVLVALVVIHYSLLAYQNYELAAAGIEIRGSTALPWGRVVRSIVTAAIIGGYLLFSKNARVFYEQKRRWREVRHRPS